MGEICEVMTRRGARQGLVRRNQSRGFGQPVSHADQAGHRAMMAGDGPRLAPPQNLAPGTLVLLTQLASQVHTLRVSEVSQLMSRYNSAALRQFRDTSHCSACVRSAYRSCSRPRASSASTIYLASAPPSICCRRTTRSASASSTTPRCRASPATSRKREKAAGASPSA
jgi:hypothetical protein